MKTRTRLVPVVLLFSIALHAQEDAYDQTLHKLVQVSHSLEQIQSAMWIAMDSTQMGADQLLQVRNFMEVLSESEDSYVKTISPFYRKYYSQEEVEELIAFYETPIGRKFASSAGVMAAEMAASLQEFMANLMGIAMLKGVDEVVDPGMEVRDPELIGTWSGEIRGESGSFVLNEDGTATIIGTPDTIGGPGFELYGVPMVLTWQTSEADLYQTLDLVMRYAGTGAEDFRLRVIYEFQDDGNVRMAIDHDGDARPDAFDPDRYDVVILNKQEE